MQRTQSWYYRQALATLRAIHYYAVATTDVYGQPWNAPSFAWHDDDLYLYWVTARTSQHAQNVSANGRAFIIIFDSDFSLDLPPGSRHGLYVQASVAELTDPGLISQSLRAQSPTKDANPTRFMGESTRRVYRAKPERVWMNDVEIRDDGTFVRDYRVELSLAKLRSRLVTHATMPE